MPVPGQTLLGSYDYIGARLTGSPSVEQNWALEAGFMDLRETRLHEDLICLGGITPEHLPELRASHEVAGEVTARAATETGLAPGTPVVAGCADHIASAFVAGAAEDGDLVVKFGGAGDIMLSCREAVTDPRMFIDFHIVPDSSSATAAWPRAAAPSTGSSPTRPRRGGGGPSGRVRRSTRYSTAGRRRSRRAPGSRASAYFLGEKTPLHDPLARGTVAGLGLHHGLPHLWRAALEAVAYGFRHHVDVFSEMGSALVA